MNDKYEITDIRHEQYPFLRRIRALRDIGEEVKAGALGGFVEHEGNLSFEPGDDAWIFGDAIACNDAYVDKGAQLWNESVACYPRLSSFHLLLLSSYLDARRRNAASSHRPHRCPHGTRRWYHTRAQVAQMLKNYMSNT